MICALKRLLFTVFQFDLSLMRQSGFEKQRMMHEPDYAPFDLRNDALGEGAVRQAVNDEHGIR